MEKVMNRHFPQKTNLKPKTQNPPKKWIINT